MYLILKLFFDKTVPVLNKNIKYKIHKQSSKFFQKFW